MRSVILFIAFSFILNIGNAQLGFTDKNEAENKLIDTLKVGKWIEYKNSAWKDTKQNKAKYYHLVEYQAGKPYGIGRDYYMSGKLQNEYPYVNGLKNGESKWYFESGKLRTKGNYIDGKRVGKSEFYYESGKIREGSEFKDNKRNGLCIRYYENGKIKEISSYLNGKRNDTCKWYFKDGTLDGIVNYINGKKNGIEKRYFNGFGLKARAETNYADGEISGIQKVYFRYGDFNLASEFNYLHNRLDGAAKTYYESGKLSMELNYSEGFQNGRCKWYYENGNIKGEAKYVDGKLDGTFITYWSNGTIKRKDKYGEGKFFFGTVYNESGKKEDYYIYEIKAQFPGGIDTLSKFFKDNLRYPESAKEDSISGTVVVGFFVEKDGSINYPEIILGVKKDTDELLQDEALRLINLMPKWTPAVIDGEKARMYQEFHIPFKL